MAADYFVMMFIASIGVYQIVSIHAKFDGLCFFKQPILQFIFGALVLIGAFVWFFTSEQRNLQSTVEGSQQLGLFLGAIVAGYAVTGILSSVIQTKVKPQIDDPPARKQHEMGVETLKTKTLFGGIASSLKKEGKDKI
jgi:hypothetical protein